MNEKAVIYARVSTDEQAKGYSLSTQIEACHEYANYQKYEVVAEFSDDYTGTAYDRPELNNLRDLVNEGGIQVVIVYDIDRLARRAVHQMLIEEEFENWGLRVEYVLGQYADTDEGRLQKQIRASIAEYEKAKIIERMKRGKRGKARSGYVVVGARPPYGYRKISEPHKAWFEIIEEEAEIIRLIYQWYLYGDGESGPISMNQIAVRLTEMRFPTRGDKKAHVYKKQGYGVWAAASVRAILRNETYTGTWYFGKTRMDNKQKAKRASDKPHPNKKGFGKQVHRDKKEWIAVPVPPIISMEDYEAAMAKIQINIENAKRNTKYNYLLRTRLRCSKCGYVLQGRMSRGHLYYYCKGREQKPVSLCDLPNIIGREIEASVWNWVIAFLSHPQLLEIGLDNIQKESAESSSAIAQRIQIVEKQIADHQEQLDRLIDLYLSGEFPKDILSERKRQIEKLLRDLRSEHEEIVKHYEENTITEEQIAELEAFCEELNNGLDNATFKEKRRILELLDVRGTLAIENEKKVVYITCQLLTNEQLRSVALTLPLSNTGAIPITNCESLLMARFR